MTITKEELMKTTNRFLYCFEHGRYIFDKEIFIIIEQFEGEDFLIDMLNCKKHPYSPRRYYLWTN